MIVGEEDQVRLWRRADPSGGLRVPLEPRVDQRRFPVPDHEAGMSQPPDLNRSHGRPPCPSLSIHFHPERGKNAIEPFRKGQRMKRDSSPADSGPFRVLAPNRVDLAGGTLDISPLYLVLEEAMTVNAAIPSAVSWRSGRIGAAWRDCSRGITDGRARARHARDPGLGQAGPVSAGAAPFPRRLRGGDRRPERGPRGVGDRRVLGAPRSADDRHGALDGHRAAVGGDRLRGDGNRGIASQRARRAAGPRGGAAGRHPGDPFPPGAHRRAAPSAGRGGRPDAAGPRVPGAQRDRAPLLRRELADDPRGDRGGPLRPAEVPRHRRPPGTPGAR
jgi:hypothetical protein